MAVSFWLENTEAEVQTIAEKECAGFNRRSDINYEYNYLDSEDYTQLCGHR